MTLRESFDREQLQGYESELLEYGTNELKKIDGIQFYGEAERKASVISFLIEGLHPYDIGTLLDKMGIAVRTGHHCTQPLMNKFGIDGTVRISFSIYNTIEEVSIFADGLKQIVDKWR